MFEMVLMAHDAVPVFSVPPSQKEETSEDFIEMIRSFTVGNDKKKVILTQLGKLNYQILESGEWLLIFCTKVSSKTLPPPENQLKELLDSILNHSFFSEPREAIYNETGTIDEEKIPVNHIESCLSIFEEKYRSQNIDLQDETINDSAMINWSTIPKKTQKTILEILEPVITGDAVSIVDTDPSAPVIKQIALLFRIPSNIIGKTSLPNYNYNIALTDQETPGNISIDPSSGKISGSDYQKNKFLEKFLEKEVSKLPSLKMQLYSINMLVETVGTSVRAVLALGSKFNKNQQLITDILNRLGFERSHLVIQILKKNFPLYYEKVVELPIHEEWFSKW